jgi:hypothetical protein
LVGQLEDRNVTKVGHVADLDQIGDGQGIAFENGGGLGSQQIRLGFLFLHLFWLLLTLQRVVGLESASIGVELGIEQEKVRHGRDMGRNRPYTQNV